MAKHHLSIHFTYNKFLTTVNLNILLVQQIKVNAIYNLTLKNNSHFPLHIKKVVDFYDAR